MKATKEATVERRRLLNRYGNEKGKQDKHSNLRKASLEDIFFISI